MNNQLSNISTQYRKFSKGQYIEHTQFNEFLDFFEDQDRLSRVMLQGVGIVCGLKPKPVYKDRVLKSIQLSQGIALTTDGDLLTLNKTNKVSDELYVSDLKTISIDQKEYTHFKKYDNVKAEYPTFYDAGKQIELWELATDSEKKSDFQPIEKLSDLENKYLLLYLENYEKIVKPCRGVDCDNHGVQQIRNIKVLVTNGDGIRYIRDKDKIQHHPLFEKDILKDVKLERVIIDHLISEQGIDKSFSSDDLKKMYSSVLEKNGYGKSVFSKINAISQIIGMPEVDHEIFEAKLKEHLTQLTGFQYVYDVVKDLTNTYSEITALLPKAFTQCFPNLVSFPKHVMLGKLTSKIQLDPYRHQFYNSPVLDDDKAGQKIRLLISRFAQQAESFRYSHDFEDRSEIKITPSHKLNSLSNQAIPFYYEVSEEFLKTWSFDKTNNRSSKENLGYNTDLLSPDAHIQNPVSFNIDRNSFYNIEGHQGMNYQEAYEQIKRIRDRQQLGFDIVMLSFTELVRNKDLSKAYFNDYVEKNSGLEHLHGVEKGGTFVMVYETNGKETTVVADFSLPYICCTPKVKINLSLPGTTICAEAGRIPFTVFPFNGVVTADVDPRFSGVVELVNGLYFFNPQLVSPELHNQEIAFSVNGSPVDCSIKVISQPKVKIDVASVAYPEGSSVETKVSFRISGDNVADYQYSWDFLGNGSFITLNPDTDGNVSYSFYNLYPKRIPTIKVNVTGNGCSQNIVISDWYKEIPIVINSIQFPEGGNCCEGVAG
ncbi:hypothetical protein [Chryseobacterium taihuense]|uniref:PKD domain-containing protein n=1 Tax=Chryseobacterium taihuense TaxID=1141221 RepID=A0ABY0QZX4_9FLAO|nr:hypothetical protein [Chryseobacterium taihuense]SDM18963.1 hypothetical protein SAMN05216273_11649 [Chryseobacterium taihuense]